MKKIFTIAATTMAIGVNAMSFDGENYIEKWGQLKLVDNQLSSANGEAIQLKGWSTFSLHFEDVNGCIGLYQLELMKRYGANVVRLAMSLDDEHYGGSYLVNPELYTDKVKDYIEDAFKAGMYVIVDWHLLEFDLISKEDKYSSDPNDYVNEAKSFFSEISKYCAEKGFDNVLYEICNEPRCESWASIKNYAEQVVPEILANQPKALIIVGTNNWCQKILDPVLDPLDQFKENVLYSFHYYACSHFSLLGDFRAAQKEIPVFVSEWSANQFNGNGPFCKKDSDALMEACGTYNTKQLVSWCIWNWGKQDDPSAFFVGTCAESNLSQRPSADSDLKYGDYVADLMGGGHRPIPCCIHRTGPFETPNKIPSIPTYLWHWDAYDYGGEGLAYHDENSSAWKKDEFGNVIDYNIGEEVDVYSLAQEMQWLDKPCPWSQVDNGKVVAFSDSINTEWTDDDNQPTYRSLNAGRNLFGEDGSNRPDEGVDLTAANLRGTDYANKGYQTLGWVEEGEWIKYTVDVAKPGYYKISGIVSGEYKGTTKNGEISISSSLGNHLRVQSDITNPNKVVSFGFTTPTNCADPDVPSSQPWNCWSEQDARSGGYNEVYCALPDSGLQEIIIAFVGDAGGVGPLKFEFVKEFEEIITCCYDPEKDDQDPTSVSDVANYVPIFSIEPNPTTGDFTVTLANDAKASVDVVNIAGQVVVSQEIVGSSIINKSLSAGVYTVVVKTAGTVDTQKLMVK